MPLFSIVIPAYNREDMLPRCLDSVLNQTYTDFEIIVVDNYSEDNTRHLLEEYHERDPRVLYMQEHNHGVIAHSRNVGIRAAKGEYIALLDSDDWFRNDKLNKIYHEIVRTEADLIYHPLIVVSKKGEHGLLGKPLLSKDKYLELLVEGDKICNSSVVVKKTIIEKIGYISEKTDLVGVEDYDCWLRIAKDNYSIAYVHEPLGYYWEGDNLSSSEKQVARINSLYEYHLPNVSDEMKDRVRYAKKYRQGRILHSIGKYAKALKIYWSLLEENNGFKEKMKLGILICFSLLRIKK